MPCKLKHMEPQVKQVFQNFTKSVRLIAFANSLLCMKPRARHPWHSDCFRPLLLLPTGKV